LIEKATFSKLGSRCPLTPTPGGSLPPLAADDVSFEYFFASCANLPGFAFSCA
jgi:hypothetical protein